MTSNFNNNSSRETTTTMKLIKPVQIIKVFNNASNNNMCGSVKTKLKKNILWTPCAFWLLGYLSTTEENYTEPEEVGGKFWYVLLF